eukprot:CAMPEP_0182531920 /NCGR_PEP_ID=MMETSP1323-20130603/10229_1 /TAXON_ID=236787 /ORGANISM="Florenciella parvula, Strain RCC1693" /LENGTH=39 /DNA_ID= /DNA_START= /DNA_END= /DNA_ORIENTATION=
MSPGLDFSKLAVSDHIHWSSSLLNSHAPECFELLVLTDG